MVTKAKVEEIKISPISYGDCPLLLHEHEVFSPYVEFYMTPEQLENPELWVNVGVKLSKDTLLEIFAFDGSFHARAIVTFAQGSSVNIKILEHIDLDRVKDKEINMSGYIIRHMGKRAGWSIIHEQSGELMTGNMPSQAACVTHLQDHFNALK